MRPTVCSVRQRQALRRRVRSLNDRVHLVEHGVERVELRSQLLLGTAAEAAAWRSLWRPMVAQMGHSSGEAASQTARRSVFLHNHYVDVTVECNRCDRWGTSILIFRVGRANSRSCAPATSRQHTPHGAGSSDPAAATLIGHRHDVMLRQCSRPSHAYFGGQREPRGGAWLVAGSFACCARSTCLP